MQVVQPPRPERVQKVFDEVAEQAGFGVALRELFRWQVFSGFVLGDPWTEIPQHARSVHCARYGITFELRWLPMRELRADRTALIQRGTMADVPPEQLDDPDGNGRPCFLCPGNMRRQFPKELLVGVNLAGNSYYLGANFAFLADNHFTVMHARHQPQVWKPHSAMAMLALAEKAEGARVIWNAADAGASIPTHEHFQVSTAAFPIERCLMRNARRVRSLNGADVWRLHYPTPAYVIEGSEAVQVAAACDEMVRQWQQRSPQNRENLIATGGPGGYRVFYFPRTAGKKAHPYLKKGDMASFELGGVIVLSHHPRQGEGGINEYETYVKATGDTVADLLAAIAPQVPEFVSSEAAAYV